MRRSEIFWGVLLVLLGGLFFLRSAGYLQGDVLGWFWPIAIVAAGVWVFLGGFRTREQPSDRTSFVIPLQGAREADLTINHGVGRMQLRAGAAPGDFLTGLAGVAMHHTSRFIGDRLVASIDAGPSVFPFIGPEGGTWRYQLNSEIPIQVSLHAGASQLEMDLTELQVTRFAYDGGASSLDLRLPARVPMIHAEIQGGAASLRIHVPRDVAARFHVKSVGSLTIDRERFRPLAAGEYESPGFGTAAHRAEVQIDGGATSIYVTQEG